MNPTEPIVPGRSCPLHYRYRPDAMREAPVEPALDRLDVLYVAGGLYGNEQALEALCRSFNAEIGRKALVFNGDFHWFDADPAVFGRVQRTVLQHHATRGNVETELAAPPPAPGEPDSGCGCGYPSWVGDGVVERSNRILARLRGAVNPAQRAELAALPMWRKARVGAWEVAIVHGDAESLAGWGFAAEHLAQPAAREQAARWLVQAGVRAYACSHTCSPAWQRLALGGEPGFVLNNGAAGMPNFEDRRCGLAVRIASKPLPQPQPGPAGALAFEYQGVHAQALAIDGDHAAFEREFARQWPPGSDAWISYAARIHGGMAASPNAASCHAGASNTGIP